MKKKLLSVLLCLTMVFALAGCGSDENTLEKIKKDGVLKISVSPDFAPYEFEDPSKSGQDKYVGADMELARYIADELGVKLEIVPMDFDACLAGVTQKKVDISISGFYPSEERKKTVDFTNAYYEDREQDIVIKKTNESKLQKLEDFSGKKVAAQNGSVQYTIGTDNMKDSELQAVNKTTDGVQMVKSEKVSGVILQKIMAESVVKSDDSLTISKLNFEYDEAELVVAVNKGQKELVKELNKIIKKVSEEKMYDKWLVDAQELSGEISAK